MNDQQHSSADALTDASALALYEKASIAASEFDSVEAAHVAFVRSILSSFPVEQPAAEAAFSAGTCFCAGVAAAHGGSCVYVNGAPKCRQQPAAAPINPIALAEQARLQDYAEQNMLTLEEAADELRASEHSGRVLPIDTTAPAPSPADERAAFVKLMGYDRPETEGVAVDVWDSQRATWLEALAFARAASANETGAEGFTYATKQATTCAGCGEHKHTLLRIDWMGGYFCLTCDRELESRSPAMAAEAQKPFGWAQPKGGNYFTRNESSAKRIGGLVPVYTAPQPAQADAPAEAREPHSDDVAVDSFAAAMKHKLALARAKGRGGWETCSPADLSRMLREHVEKGDPRDVANFCMMLWHHGSPIVSAPADARVAQAGARVGLTDEQIDEIARPFAGLGGIEDYRAFARALLAAHPGQPEPKEPPSPDDIQGWAVTVEVNGVGILTISDNCVSGIDNIAEFDGIVRNCAQHLIGFIGQPEPRAEVTGDTVLVPKRVVELLRIINRDGIIKRASELQEVYRLVDASRAQGGEKFRYCSVCCCKRWFTDAGDCVVCIGLFNDAYGTNHEDHR
ncbi:hypothetical protein [Burkholderia multivorans]|uniref:hypothetical protein n=1 Tax=Burkholderia multivorans TaxID=87883 RepID=UPI001C21B598|nr:hypothetical protein [Burkholderia multivorans]MBU9164238.1 hypothetical protein [Burkholderia multivorans]